MSTNKIKKKKRELNNEFLYCPDVNCPYLTTVKFNLQVCVNLHYMLYIIIEIVVEWFLRKGCQAQHLIVTTDFNAGKGTQLLTNFIDCNSTFGSFSDPNL